MVNKIKMDAVPFSVWRLLFNNATSDYLAKSSPIISSYLLSSSVPSLANNKLSRSTFFFHHLLYLRARVLSGRHRCILFGILFVRLSRICTTSITSINHYTLTLPILVFSPQTVISDRLSHLFLAILYLLLSLSTVSIDSSSISFHLRHSLFYSSFFLIF